MSFDRNMLGRRIEDLLDGVLAAEEANELSRLISENDAARDYYLARMAQVSALEDSNAESDASASRSNPPRAPISGFMRVAAVLLLGLALWALLGRPMSAPAPITAGTLTAVDGDVRTADGSQLAVGDLLGAQSIRVDGLAELVMRGGTTVSIEGPARLELTNANRAVLREGRLTAQVPPQATGFTVSTAHADIVDLGTEFGVSALAGEPTAVHVFKGRVRVKDLTRGGTTLLQTNDAMQLDGRTANRTMRAQRSVFVEIGAVRAAPDYRRWVRSSRALAQDKALVYHRDFRFPEVGVRQAPGRWPNKWAAEFHQPGDGLSLNLPGHHEQLSMAAWVRFDRFDQMFHSLVMSNGWHRGDVHWQVHRRGPDNIRLEFSVKHSGPFSANQSTKSDYFSKDVLDDADAGRWIHLAVVYDQRKGRITHFVDGAVVGEESVREADPAVEIGDAQLGNWDLPHEKDTYPVRVLIGRLDEIAVWNRALHASEVQRLFRAGRPD